MAVGDPRSPLVGSQLHDRETLVSEGGMALLVENGIVAKFDDSQSLESEFSVDSDVDSRIDVKGKAIIPGFVDSHTHLLWSGDRSNEMRLRQSGLTYQEIAQQGGGIRKTVNATRSSSSGELFESGKARLQRAVDFGTTSIECKSGYGLSTETELRLLDIVNRIREDSDINIHSTWLGAHDFPSDLPPSQYLEELLSEQMPAIIEQGFSDWVDVFCEPGWYSLDQTELIVRAATDAGLPSRLHVDEFVDGGGLSLAAELGSASGDHVGHSSDDARAKAAGAGTMQTFLPGTPYVLGKQLELPLQKCLDEDWQFSLATDFNPNCRSLSIPFVGSLATHRMGISPIAALAAVTRNPATSLLRSEQDLVSGSIRVGGKADFVILNGDDVDCWCQMSGDNPVMQTIASGAIVSS